MRRLASIGGIVIAGLFAVGLLFAPIAAADTYSAPLAQATATATAGGDDAAETATAGVTATAGAGVTATTMATAAATATATAGTMATATAGTMATATAGTGASPATLPDTGASTGLLMQTLLGVAGLILIGLGLTAALSHRRGIQR